VTSANGAFLPLTTVNFIKLVNKTDIPGTLPDGGMAGLTPPSPNPPVVKMRKWALIGIM
jgi:hypothetical protein